MAKIFEFSVGHCTHPACMALKGAGLASRCFPSRAYLLDTRQGLMLWDTGYAEHFLDATRSGIYRLYPVVTPVFFDPAQSLRAQLFAAGIAPNDIHTIALSHFHADHLAGLRDFPKARLMVSGVGWKAVRGLTGLAALRQAFLPPLLPADMESRMSFMEELPQVPLPVELAPFVSGRDIFGSAEVYVVDLPGHAVGHMGAFVQGDAGWILLASDAAWSTQSVRELRGPSELSFLIQHNRRDYYRTLTALHQLHRAGGTDIRLTHQEAT
jgi:glyoxylase-like metal-dependent hydrolase (beta-lactamase superfamily II)